MLLLSLRQPETRFITSRFFINEGKGIDWLCRVYDPEWGPAMLKSWDSYELTGSGDFFKKAMHGELAVQKD